MKEGGGRRLDRTKQRHQQAGNGSSDDAAGQESKETTGTVNSISLPLLSSEIFQNGSAFASDLIGTDIDVITTSLPSVVQLMAVPFKFVVSLVYLYVLLGWR
jgi:hypothetical protein